MSLFKKLIPGGKSEEKRKEKIVKDLQKQSPGFSVAFMQEIKEKTRAIRMLKLENDEWSDDEEPEPTKKAEAAPKKLEAVAKLMHSRKASEKQKYWSKAEKVAAAPKGRLHEHYKQASMEQNNVIKEAAQLANLKAVNRTTIMQKRADGGISGAKSAPASPHGSLRRAVQAEDLTLDFGSSLTSKLEAVANSDDQQSGSAQDVASREPPKKKSSKGSFSIFGHRRKVSEPNLSDMVEIENATAAAASSASQRSIVPERKRAATWRGGDRNESEPVPLPLPVPKDKDAKDKKKDRLKDKDERKMKSSKSSAEVSVSSIVHASEPRVKDDFHKDKIDIPIRIEKKSKRSSAPSPDKQKLHNAASSKSSRHKSSDRSDPLASSSTESSEHSQAADSPSSETVVAENPTAADASPSPGESLSPSPCLSAPATPPPELKVSESAPPTSGLQPSASDPTLTSATNGTGAANRFLQPLAAGSLKRSFPPPVRKETQNVEVAAGKTVEIIRRLGKGGTGIVWEAILQGRPIALKQISLHEMSKAKQTSVRNQIKKELDLMKPFRHDNVLRYFGMFYSKVNEEINLVMELVDGVSVTDAVVCQSKLPEKVAAFILKQAITGLVFLHENCIIHRDLKPDNMLIDSNGVVKLIDFGCSAKILPEEILKRRSTVGTPWYCSPEIVNSEEYGPKCDMWSIGCSTIELVTGKPPFDDLNDVACLFKVAEGNPPPLPAGVSPECTDFLSKCLNPNQADRPSAAELLEHPFLRLSSEDWQAVEADVKALISEMNEQRQQVEAEGALSSSK